MVQRRRQSRGTTAAERVLLEIAGCPADQESALPPGRRDDGGFWYPVGYALPRDVCDATREGRPRRGRPRRPQEGGPAPPAGSAGSSLPSGTDDTTSIVESEFVDSRERSD